VGHRTYVRQRQVGVGRPLNAALVTSLSPAPLQVLPETMDPKLIRLTRLLIDLWEKIAFPTSDDSDTNFRIKDYELSRGDIRPFLKHFQVCRDTAADGAFLMASTDANGDDVLQLSNIEFPMTVEDEDAEEWGMFDPELLGSPDQDVYVPPFPAEASDDRVMADTKEWVRRVIADMNVCPFTVDPEKAGIPMGGVRYTISRAKSPDEAFLRFWQEVYALFSSSEKDMSTVLLVFPELDLFGNFELFEGYCEALNDGLCSSSMCMENQIQLVFFHPKYSFRDGQARVSTETGAANFARRGPWPMINILRTPQVRLAQKGVPTGIVYKQNEERLTAVGATVLEKMLFDRNWEGLPVHSTSAAARILREKALDEQREQEAKMFAEAAAKGVCPFPHAGAAAATIAPAAAAAAAAPAPAPTPARVSNDQNQDELKRLVEPGAGGSSEEELLRLADEVSRWLEGGAL